MKNLVTARAGYIGTSGVNLFMSMIEQGEIIESAWHRHKTNPKGYAGRSNQFVPE
jgi:hypothetical protein